MEFGTGDIRMTGALSGGIGALCYITQKPHVIGERVPVEDSWNVDQADDTKHDHRAMANSIPASCDFSMCFTHSKGDRKMVGQEDGTVARRAAPEDRRKI